MIFTDIGLLTDDVPRLAAFYEKLFGIRIEMNDVHTQFQIGTLSIALYSKQAAVKDMRFDFGVYNGTGCMTIGFNVEDVDAQYERLRALQVNFVTSPTTYPWGARAVHFRDPDGNIICFRTIPG